MALIVLFAILKGLEFLNKRMAQGMFPWAILFACRVANDK